MNPPFRILLFVAIVLAGSFASEVHARQEDQFATANREFSEGRYREAIEHYSRLVERGETSAPLFYNLGNAWHRLGDPGRAILNYERALALEPHHPETVANLRLVRDKARALELRWTGIDRGLARGTSLQYTIAAAVSFWIAAFGVAALVVTRQRRVAALRAGVTVALLILAGSIYVLYALELGPTGPSLAIVTVNSIEARLATADNAGTVLALPPGSEIKILNKRGDWIYAALPNDLRGWIPAGSAERVRL